MFRPLQSREVAVLLGSLGAIAAVTAALKAVPQVSPTTAALLLLLVVVGAATLARLRTAIAVSLLAMLALNFYFLPPLGSLLVVEAQNWIALFAFLVVAIIASNLSTAAQDRARDAVARRFEVTRLFHLTCDVLLTTESTGAMEVLARHVAQRFKLSTIALCLPHDDGWHIYQGGSDALVLDVGTLESALTRARASELDAGQRAHGGHVRVGGPSDVLLVPLRHGTKAVGLLAAPSTTLDIGTLDAIAGVVAIAIERAQFLGERDAAELVRQKADLATTLLASLSHDLRTPLTAIRVAVENLLGELTEPERVAQVSAAMTELERLTRLLQDILEMARIDAEAIRIEQQWVTAAEVVDAALAHVRHAVGGHALQVEADDDHEVRIDPRLASVALAHVIENAAHYSPADQPILVCARATADGLHISVTDQGAGLEAGELEHIFERFYRGYGARHTTFGTGMGLSITRGLLSAAGGRIWAENSPGAGAMFSLVVPGAVRPATVTS
jgi:two-component system, OmpR family, sensor histidine kinase KdpD